MRVASGSSSVTASCPIPARSASSKRTTECRWAPGRSRPTISSSSIRRTTAIAAQYRRWHCGCTRSFSAIAGFQVPKFQVPGSWFWFWFCTGTLNRHLEPETWNLEPLDVRARSRFRHPLERQHERLGAAAAVALGAQADVELVHERQARQRDVHAIGLGQRDAHVLDEVLNEEAWSEVAFDDARRQVVECPAGGGSAPDALDHCLERESRLIGVEQALADADHRARDHDLIAHLRVLAGAGSAEHDDPLAHCLEERHDAVDSVAIAPDHDRQRGVARAHVAARNRGVDAGRALLPR